MPPGNIMTYFGRLNDPRRPYLISYQLVDILTIAVCALLAGADNFEEVALFGQTRAAWFATFLDLSHGIPSPDTFNRVFAALDPQGFAQAFADWVEAIRQVLPVPPASDLVVRAIDGKQVRGSRDRAHEQAAVDLVRVWASEAGLALGQQAVDEKSNEITAIPLLLRQLDVHGCIVTIDAMGCQTAIAQQIIDQEGEYVLALKGNQGTLLAEVQDGFAQAAAEGYQQVVHTHATTTDQGHGRVEERQAWVITDPPILTWLQATHQWPGLRAIGQIVATRDDGTHCTCETRYYLLSTPLDAAMFGRVVRTHWQIENQLHWVLDMAFREDLCRVRTGHAAANLALVRQFALTLLKHSSRIKLGIKAKRMLAAWDQTFLLALLRAS